MSHGPSGLCEAALFFVPACPAIANVATSSVRGSASIGARLIRIFMVVLTDLIPAWEFSCFRRRNANGREGIVRIEAKSALMRHPLAEDINAVPLLDSLLIKHALSMIEPHQQED